MLEMSRLGLLVVILATAGLFFSVCSTSAAAENPAAVQGAGKPNQFIVELKLIEIDRKKLRQLGIDFVRQVGSAGGSFEEADLLDIVEHTNESGTVASDAVLQLIESLRRNGALQILAEPELAFVEGREAAFAVGNTIEAPLWEDPIEGKGKAFLGTRLNLRASLVENGRVALNLRLIVTNLEEPTGDRPVQSRINIRQIETELVVKSGEIMLLPDDSLQIYCIAKANTAAGSSDSAECERVEDDVVEDKMSYLLVKATLVDEKLSRELPLDELNALGPVYGVVEEANPR